MSKYCVWLRDWSVLSNRVDWKQVSTHFFGDSFIILLVIFSFYAQDSRIRYHWWFSVDGYFFKMISIVRRSSTLAQNLVKESSKSVKLHVFEKPPVSNLDELNQYLLNNIIYNNEGKNVFIKEKSIMWIILFIKLILLLRLDFAK